MTFDDALKALRRGEPVSRSGWNGKGMFLYLVDAGNYPAKSYVAKEVWGEEGLVPYTPYIAIKSVNSTVTPWVASQTDLLAADWDALSLSELSQGVNSHGR